MLRRDSIFTQITSFTQKPKATGPHSLLLLLAIGPACFITADLTCPSSREITYKYHTSQEKNSTLRKSTLSHHFSSWLAFRRSQNTNDIQAKTNIVLFWFFFPSS